MMDIKNAEVFGINRAINAINNSFNVGEINTAIEPDEKKVKVARALGKNMDAHQSHDAYLKGILVTFDMKGNGVILPEIQRYHHFEIIMSQSSQHSLDKFMTSKYDPFTKYVSEEVKNIAKKNYEAWKKVRDDYEKAQAVHILSDEESMKWKIKIYHAMEILMHNLPRGFELWSTITTNYLQLKTIVIQRANHKQQEDWCNFVEFCYSLPYFRELCGFTDKKWDLENIFPLAMKLKD